MFTFKIFPKSCPQDDGGDLRVIEEPDRIELKCVQCARSVTKEQAAQLLAELAAAQQQPAVEAEPKRSTGTAQPNRLAA